MADFRALAISLLFLYFSANIICKIVLPHKLRYLENMLNSEVMAKAAKIRQRIEANPNIQDGEKSWPMLLAQYQAHDKRSHIGSYSNMYDRRVPNFT